MGLAHPPLGYVARLGERCVLHRAVREDLETFLARMREQSEHGFGMPRFVEKELRGFLRCGVLAHGFVRVRCTSCGDELLVGFSCKARAVCPSCTARRAADCAAHLVDEVFPRVPVRQWVLTFPRRLRFALARESTLATKVIAIWLRALETHHRRRARRVGIDSPAGGAVTFAQRFGSSLALNLHLHTARPDGVFTLPPDGERATFVRLRPPSTDEVEDLLLTIVKRVRRCMKKHFTGREDELAYDVMAQLQTASLTENRTNGVDDERPGGRFEAFFEGFSLHCGTHLHENDREGVERLFRYGARGPLALGRLSRDDDGRYRYRMKRVVNGKAELVMTGEELIAKLAVLIPPPRVHTVRFHGCFAPNAKVRARVVPKRVPAAASAPSETASKDATYRHEWAALIRRVFKADVLVCATCEGKMRVIATIEDRDVIAKILAHLRLPTTALPIWPARGPPQGTLAFEAA